MLIINEYLAGKQKAFKSHQFFRTLEKQDEFFKTMAFTPNLTFWVMTFQDILRLIPKQITKKELRRIATHHKMEDAGHDKWFLQDISYLRKGVDYNVEWLYSPENQNIRDFTYNIVAEAIKPSSDHLKVLLILLLESTGHVFFEHIANFAKRKGHDSDLKYFSSHHLEVELNHSVFEGKLEEELFSIELTAKERAEAVELIDRLYEGWNNLFTDLALSFDQRPVNQNVSYEGSEAIII